MGHFLTPTVIIENTQLGKVVSLLKGLERCFSAEDEKFIFLHNGFRTSESPWLLHKEKVMNRDWTRLFM